MDEYQQKVITDTDYARVLNQAERIFKYNEHEVFHTEARHLYSITLDFRSDFDAIFARECSSAIKRHFGIEEGE